MAAPSTSPHLLGALTGSLDRGNIDLPTAQPAARNAAGWFIAIAGRCKGLDAFEVALSGNESPDAALGCLQGAFALLAWHRDRGTGFLARDQLGGREVFYGRRDNGALVFSDTVRGVLELLQRTPGPDHSAVATWLGSGTIPLGMTVYEGVYRMRPGHRLQLPSASEHRWWRLEPLVVGDRTPEGLAHQTVEHVRGALARAQSWDAPAVLTSGGLDSSAILSLTTELQRAGGAPDPVAFSAVFPRHPTVNEQNLIRQLCAHVGVDAVEAEILGGNALRTALLHLERWRIPTLSPNGFIWQAVHNQMHADGHRVALDGEGGDELFAFQPWYLADLTRQLHWRTAWELSDRLPGLGGRGRRVRLRMLRYIGRQGLTPGVLQRAAEMIRPYVRHSPGLLNRSADLEFRANFDPWRWKRLEGPLWQRHLIQSITDDRDLLDAHGVLFRRGAESGIDARHPFLHDVALARWAVSVPPGSLFDPEADRPLLRAGLRGRIPDSIRLRQDKSYFNDIAADAVAGASLQFMTGLVRQNDARVRAWIDPRWLVEGLDAEMATRPQPTAERTFSLFRLGSVECWLRSLEDDGWIERQLEALPAADPISFTRRAES